MKIFLFIFTFIFSAHVYAQDPKGGCCKGKFSSDELDQQSIEELSLELKKTKKLKCAACSLRESYLQHIMNAIGKKILGSTYKELKKTMGKSPAVLSDHGDVNTVIYTRGGSRDYMVFTVKDHKVVSFEWYYSKK